MRPRIHILPYPLNRCAGLLASGELVAAFRIACIHSFTHLNQRQRPSDPFRYAFESGIRLGFELFGWTNVICVRYPGVLVVFSSVLLDWRCEPGSRPRFPSTCRKDARSGYSCFPADLDNARKHMGCACFAFIVLHTLPPTSRHLFIHSIRTCNDHNDRRTCRRGRETPL